MLCTPADQNTQDVVTVQCTTAVKKVQAVSENTIRPLVKVGGHPRKKKRAGKLVKAEKTLSDPLDAIQRSQKRLNK